MKSFIKVATLFVIGMLFLSCSAIENEESISFDKEPSFSVTIDRVIEDKLTMVLVVDDSASMVAKTRELESDMESMFTDLIEAKWDIDLHLVTCAFYKANDSAMKSVSTESFSDRTTSEKVAALMAEASPKVDMSTLQNDADERCNQSLEKAWGIIEPKNKINLSLIISNEDGCGRNDSDEILVNLDGSPRDNCAPITYNQIASTGVVLADFPTNEWAQEIESHSNNVWIPWFNTNIKQRLTPPESYVDFIMALEERGSQTVENFSHIYLPIVVDSPACLAETLYDQYLIKENAARDEVAASYPGPGSDIVFDGLEFPSGTRDILGNIGYSYLDTFDLLEQNIEFNRADGDLSLCKDLSHIVDKISQEIKLRGSGIMLQLPRPIDLITMKNTGGDNFDIITITRPDDVEEDGFFQLRNEFLRPFNLEWVRTSDTHWTITFGFASNFIRYDHAALTIEILPNRLIYITGGDEISVLEYDPIGFKEN